jgi:hypothetical protein
MSTSIVSGLTQQYYHVLPSDLDLIKTSPTREAIFKYLSQISYEEFPEFILDILIMVEGHKSVDITDGPGDEKQDILTFDLLGRRCLTQCKHKENPDGKYSGDELDRIVAACLRKNCIVATFVTNGELSPQAKSYITDKEFSRGWPDSANPLVVDYWNGYKIWEKIKNNKDILHKWFSGMGQSHGLRMFRFEVSAIRMPFETIQNVLKADELIKLLGTKQLIKCGLKENEYEGMMETGISFKLKPWFQIGRHLRLKTNIPEKKVDFWQQPMDALSIEVHIPGSLDKYSPSGIKQELLNFLFTGMDSSNTSNQWIYLLASQTRSFLYLHDISEPRELELDGARPFIIRNNSVISEYTYCDLDSQYFKVKPNSEGEKAIFIHTPSSCECVQFFEQSLSPAETYSYQRLQLDQISTLAQFEFRKATGLDRSQFMRIRRILDLEWVAFSDDSSLYWCYPPNTEQSKIKYIEQKLNVLGIHVIQVNDKERQHILSNLSKDVPALELITITELGDAGTPIDLQRRGFWIYKELALEKKLNENFAMDLVKFKFSYERRHGYDNMGGNKNIRTHTSELPNWLCDMFTVRADRMIDIAILGNPIIVNLRYFSNSLASSIDLANEAISEFEIQFKNVKKILADLLAK